MDEEEFTLPALLVTDDVIQGLQSGSILASDAGATLPGVNEENQLAFLTQLCDAYVEKKLDSDQVLAGIAAAGLTHDIGQDLAEALWYATLKVSSKAVKGDKDTHEHLADLAKELIKKNKLTRAQLLAVGEAELLDACAITKIPWTARDKRTLTSMYYKQDKYNLLREQNEGYGKLAAELLSGGPLLPEHLPALSQQIKGHIGTFNLDPNRVCDLVLDAAEAELALCLQAQAADRQQDPHASVPVPVWLELMSLFSNDAPMLMLARKFLHYQQERPRITGDETEEELTGPPPPSLYLLAACMIKCGQVTLEQVLPYLGPTDEMKADHDKARKQLDDDAASLLLAVLDTEGDSIATKKMDELARGGLDAVAKARGITNRADDDGGGGGGGYDRRGGGSMGPPGGGMGPPQHRNMGGGMQGGPPGMGNMWPRGIPPGQAPGMGGQFGGYSHGMPGYGMSPGHYQGAQGIGGPNMGGPAAQPGPSSSGAPRASGGGGGQAAPAAAATAAAAPTDASGQRYNIMPAEDLMLDARHYDKQLLDPSCGQLQLLRALMQADAWEAAVLMLQWLQDVVGVLTASDRRVAAALGARVKQLLQPVHSKLYPQGPSCGNVLERFAERPSSARDKDRESKLLVFTAEQRSAPPFGPALDPAVYRLLAFLGPYIYRDSVLMVMLLKVFRHELLFYAGMLQGQVNKDTMDKVCEVLSSNLMPALAQHRSNLGMANMVWDVLAHMPFPYRGEVYRKSLLAAAACPVSRGAANTAVKSFRSWKRRIALPDKDELKVYKAVVRGHQRLIAKITHAAPLQVCEEIIRWAMNTPTQCEALAEVIKMHNRLTCDALTYQALFLWDRLGFPKIKSDGTSEAEFMQGLCDLVGRAALAHPWSSFDIGVVLRYAASTLRSGDTEVVLLLKKVVYWLSGIDGPTNADPCNYMSLCLGPQITAFKRNDQRKEQRMDKLQVKGRRMLGQLLMSPRDQLEQQLLVPLIVSLSQHLDWTAYTKHTLQVKEVAEMYDKVSHATQQYIMLLEQFLTDEEVTLKELTVRLPPLNELIQDYKVAPGIAWCLWRHTIKALEPALAARLAKQQQEDGTSTAAALEWAAAASGDTSAAAGGGGGDDGEEGEVEEGEAMQGQEGPGADKAAEIIAAADKAAADQGLPTDVEALLGSVNALGPDMFEHLTPQLYLAFWSMELNDIYYPSEQYASVLKSVENAISKYPAENGVQHKNIRLAQDKIRSGHRNVESLNKEIAGASAIIETNTALLNYAKAFEKPLKAERDAAAARHGMAIKRLQAEKHLYVTDAKQLRVKLHAFIKYCLLPRLTRSAADAVYCHFFCLKLHELDVPYWPAGFFWDDAMVSLTNIIPTATEKEAGYLAMFLGLSLIKIQEWFGSAEKYKQECDRQTMRQSVDPSNRLSHLQFQRLFRKWQNSLHRNLLECLRDKEQYYQRRNAIIIITKLTQADPNDAAPPMYPFYKAHFEELTKVLDEIFNTETRADLKHMAFNSTVHLSRRGQNCIDMPAGPGRTVNLNRPRGPPVGGRAAGGVKPPASPARPAQQQQRAGASSSRPSTPPSAAAAGEDKQQTKPAAAAGGEKAGGSSAQPPKAVRKAAAAAAGPAVAALKKAVDAAAAPQAAAATAGGKQTQRPQGAKDEPPIKRARTTAVEAGKGDGPTATAAGAAGGGGNKEGRDSTAAKGLRGEGGKGEDARSSKQQQQQGGGSSRPSSRPPSGSDRVAAVAAADRGGGSGSRAASPVGAAASPGRQGGGGDRSGGGDRVGSRMGAHHSSRDLADREREHQGSRDHTPQRHGGHTDEPHSKSAAAAAGGEDRKDDRGGKGRSRSRDGDRGRDRGHERDGSKDRAGKHHHSPEHKRSSVAAAAAAADEVKDSGKQEKRGGKREGGRRVDKEGAKKEARPADESREDSHDSKRRRLNEAPAAAADGASSREQRQQHGSNDGARDRDRDRGEANGHRAAAAAAGSGGTKGRGSEQQQQGGEKEQKKDRDGDKQDRKVKVEKEGEQQQQPRHARISFPGADDGGKGSDKPPPRQSTRKR